ncbi:MAG: HEAT repeat domain-containing protein [Mangrovicoccus sp.]
MPLVSNRIPQEEASGPKTVAASLARLGSPDAQTRRDAARDLTGIPDAVPALVNALEIESKAAVRQALISALVAVGDPAIAAPLTEMLRSEDAAKRSEAVSALQQLPEIAAEVIAGLLDSEDSDLKIMAVDVIRMLPDAEAPGWLRHLLAHETHPNVVGVAVDRLAEIGGPDDLPVLHALRDRFTSDPYVSFAVELVIDRIATLDREAAG